MAHVLYTWHTCDFVILKMSKSRGWTFTLNNYTIDDIKMIQAMPCDYLFQEETGESGTKHLQGMLYYNNAVSFNSIRNAIPRAHIEKMKNKIASIKYCSKEDTRSGQMYTNMTLDNEIGTLAHCVKAEKKKCSTLEDQQQKIKMSIEYLSIARDLYIRNKKLFEKLIDEETQSMIEEEMNADLGSLSSWHL